MMSLGRFWCVLCVLGSLSASQSMNMIEYEGNYADNYDNEISQDQQEGGPPSPCQAADFSRWDKLFITLEDSHMRQNTLLESLETCCGRMASLRALMHQRTSVSCEQCGSSMESLCQRQTEQGNLRLQQSLTELREEGAERERRLNDTLKMLLHSFHISKTQLSGLEEGGMGHKPPQRTGDLEGAFGFMMKPLPSGQKEQEVTSSLDIALLEKALVAIATELQTVHVQLSKVIEQVETMRKDREI